MLVFLQLILLLPALASCGITITLKLNQSKLHYIEFDGYDSHVIDDKERNALGLTFPVMQDAAEKYTGRRHNTLLLHKPKWMSYFPGPWTEVHRVLTPLRYDILRVKKENLLVDYKELNTNLANANITKEEHLKNSVNIEWAKAGIFSIKEDIVYTFEPAANFTTSCAWGTNLNESRDILITKKIEAPHKTPVLPVVIAKKITVTIRIEFSGVLSGDVAGMYTPQNSEEYHWYHYNITKLFMTAGLPTTVNSIQIITLRYHVEG